MEAGLSIYLENFATSLGSREQLAIAEFADALLVLPKTLAVNAAKVRQEGSVALALPAWECKALYPMRSVRSARRARQQADHDVWHIDCCCSQAVFGVFTLCPQLPVNSMLFSMSLLTIFPLFSVCRMPPTWWRACVPSTIRPSRSQTRRGSASVAWI